MAVDIGLRAPASREPAASNRAGAAVAARGHRERPPVQPGAAPAPIPLTGSTNAMSAVSPDSRDSRRRERSRRTAPLAVGDHRVGGRRRRPRLLRRRRHRRGRPRGGSRRRGAARDARLRGPTGRDTCGVPATVGTSRPVAWRVRRHRSPAISRAIVHNTCCTMRSHSLLVRPAMTSSMPGKSGLHPQRSYDLRWLRLSGKTWRWTAASLPLEPSHLAATRLVGGCSTASPAERHLLDPSVAVPQVTEPDPSPIRTYAGSAVVAAASAQIGWQRSADGSEAMAVAQIRWHRTRCYLASCPIYTFCLL